MLFSENSIRAKSLLVSIILASFFLSSCADDQARAQIADTDARLMQLEHKVGILGNKVSNRKMLDILNKLDELQSQIDQINGNFATLQHNQQTFQDTQSQLNQNLEQQAQSDSGLPSANNGINSGSVSADKPTQISSDKVKLNVALKKIKAHSFNSAIKDLRVLVASSKDATIVSTASYYLTVAYAANGEYKNAISVGRKFVNANPKSYNAPDALFTIYVSQQQLGMKNSAANTASLLKKNYPNSQAAKKIQ